MPKATHITSVLAINFVEHFLHQKFDFRLHGRYLRDSKRFVNPDKEGEVPFDPNLVWGCLLALEKGMFGFEGSVSSMWVITYGSRPNYYEQYKEYFDNPPSFYEADLIREWETLTGKSYPRTQDDGKMVVPFIPLLEYL
jgi:hypothetical protein